MWPRIFFRVANTNAILCAAAFGLFVIVNDARADVSASPVVVLDAGHGGRDWGAVIGKRKWEKEIVLEIVLKLQKRLSALGFSPVLTRESDRFIELSDRVERAEKSLGRAFVSIHVDETRSRVKQGVILYTYGENRLIPPGPRRLHDKRLPPPPKEQIRASRRLAASVLNALRRAKIASGEADHGAFAVLKSSNMPSVLVEVGNLRSSAQAEHLADKQFQDRLARALADGVSNYLRGR